MKHNLPTWKGYEAGLKALETFIKWCRKHEQIESVTLYLMSEDNYKNRPPEDIQYLFNAMKTKLVELKDDNVRVKVWGDWKSVHDTDLVNVITDVIDTTKNYVKTTLHLLFNWITTDDGRSTDIPDINLLIRTGGYHRLSGFVPFKCAYSELYFLDNFFPDCTEKDWEDALIWYEHQEQHFGA